MAPVQTPPMHFGSVSPSTALDAFRREMNGEVMALLRSLPKTVHTDAAVCLMRHFGALLLPEFDFFRTYFTPAWSILFWLEQKIAENVSLSAEERRHARAAHAMALFLHPLDDHLHDGQLPASHLLLLLRSQAWRRMCEALEALAAAGPGGEAILRGRIEAYYASIGQPPAEETLDGYCRHFQDQMATWMTVPLLMASRLAADKGVCEAVQCAYGGFGTAWRLLDDLQDLALDIQTRHHSAVYYLLPLAARQCWDRTSGGDADGRQGMLWRAVHACGAVERLRRRLFKELQSAAAAAETIDLTELAGELRCLARPFAGDGAAP